MDDDVRRALDPMITAVEREAGCWLPQETHTRFIQIYHAIRGKLAPHVCNLPPMWLTKLKSNIVETETGLKAVYYHMENISSLEDRILKMAHAHLPDRSLAPRAGGTAGHNTAKVNFEYHAFVLAAQRTLEYFALSVEAFFQIDNDKRSSRIKPLGREIKEKEPADIRDHVLQRLGKARRVIPAFIPDVLAGRHSTTRDIISHVKNIEPVYLHMLGNEAGWQVRLKGGALSDRINEDIAVHPSSLSAVLWDDLKEVEKLILGTYWDFGLLEFPRTGGTSVNAELAEI
jgi:hypothetical protein